MTAKAGEGVPPGHVKKITTLIGELTWTGKVGSLKGGTIRPNWPTKRGTGGQHRNADLSHEGISA